MRTSTLSALLTGGILCTAAAGLLSFPSEISQAICEGLSLCGTILLPNLFPFFVLSALAVHLGLSGVLGQLLEPLMQPLFRLPGVCASALILGFLGGYPTGAKTAVSLYQSGHCTKDQAQRLLGFCNNCGPAFLIGVVGIGQFGHLFYGLLLAGVHVAAAILCGVFLSIHAPKEMYPIKKRDPESFLPLPRAFTKAVTDSAQSLLNLFSFVLCFCALLRLFQLSGIPRISARFLLPFLSGSNGESLLSGLLEMTNGVAGIRGGSTQERLILTSLLLGWGGLSVHCQTLSLLGDCNLSPTYYWKGKALHALLSAALMALILWQAEVLCFLCGFLLLTLPKTHRKKDVEKPRKIYYNGYSLKKEL